MMNRISTLALLLVVVVVASALHTTVDAAVEISLGSSKVALSKEALRFDIVVSPPQNQLKEVTVETLIDTTGNALISDLKVKGNGEKFAVSLGDDKKLPAGMYKMKVSAEDNNTKEVTSKVLQLKVTVPVVITSIELNGQALKDVDKIQGHEFSSASGDGLKIDVKLQHEHEQTPITAHQVFIRFTHLKEGTNTYFALTPDKYKTHGHVLNFAALSKKFAYNSGTHKVELIVGDPTFEKAIVRDLGTVELLLGAAPPTAPSPLYAKPLLHESDTTLKALPEIKHVMRPQDSRPPIVVSIAFTAVVLAPLLGFLLFVLKLQLNVRKLFHGSTFLFGTVFLTSVAATFALFGWYWLELTMYRTLGYLGVLSLVSIWSGHLTLKRLAHYVTSPSGKKGKIE